MGFLLEHVDLHSLQSRGLRMAMQWLIQDLTLDQMEAWLCKTLQIMMRARFYALPIMVNTLFAYLQSDLTSPNVYFHFPGVERVSAGAKLVIRRSVRHQSINANVRSLETTSYDVRPPSAGDDYVLVALEEATQEVDRALNSTLEHLFQGNR